MTRKFPPTEREPHYAAPLMPRPHYLPLTKRQRARRTLHHFLRQACEALTVELCVLCLLRAAQVAGAVTVASLFVR